MEARSEELFVVRTCSRLFVVSLADVQRAVTHEAVWRGDRSFLACWGLAVGGGRGVDLGFGLGPKS